MYYKKKPIVIEAFKYDGDFMNAQGQYHIPDWAITAYHKGTMYFAEVTTEDGVLVPGVLHIKTLEGPMTASVGDFIIKGVKGELYACKPDIFESSYDEAKAEVLSPLAATVQLMNSAEYKDRFIAEYKQLTIRLDGLSRMIYSYKTGTLNFTPKCDILLLSRQLQAMHCYANALEDRAIIEDINLNCTSGQLNTNE